MSWTAWRGALAGRWLRGPWALVLGGAFLILLVAGGTVAIRMTLWASVPYRGYGASYAIVEIPEGAGLARAVEILESHGIVRHFNMTLLWLRLTGRRRPIKAGEYSFTRPMAPGEVFDKVIAGDVYYHRVTILEGSRSDEIFAQFVRAGFGSEPEYLEAFNDVSLISDLDDDAVDLEGYLFPDTYSLEKGTAPRTIIARMVARFREVFQPEWIEQARQGGLSIRQTVTLASLVERETSSAEENPVVSSVFHNRLRKKMRLQCDPTVIYALAMRGVYDGNIRKDDLSVDSRYNTYRYFGLPPGPIGNPGAAALRAAVEPADTRYLYFVSMNTGRHKFSETLREHNEAVWQYQKKPFRVRRLARSRAAGRGN
ncbi:MAG TPA: endolytic transglycosylase MltG [Candidatus Polarisedimenticolia bacterium]|nr:endolytic transglycosylase MltG [Candidatus Polarisedimenticolia bacterium]